MKRRTSITLVAVMLSGLPSVADIHYVSPSGAHTPPFTNWPTAATNMQAAIDTAVSNDTVLVANGVYDTGGVVTGPYEYPGGVIISDTTTNRIAVPGGVTVRSANGPEHTMIVGNGPAGDAAVRCAYVGPYARLEGFTLTNGHTRTWGVDEGNQAGGGAWCHFTLATVSNCIITGNAASRRGGGVKGGTLLDCLISSNSAYLGGGTMSSTLESCSIVGNRATGLGGGMMTCTTRNSIVTGNSADGVGGGAHGGALENCVVTGNTSGGDGGGVHQGTLQGCLVHGNTAGGRGGGTYESAVRSCTVTSNSATDGGGVHMGTWDGSKTVRNSIVYYNDAPANPNWARGGSGALGKFEFVCTEPATLGLGNITKPPRLVAPGNAHLLAGSPCIDAGTNLAWMADATDIDGEPRIGNGTVDMGCDEFHEGGLTGPLAATISAGHPTVAAGHPVDFTADIEGRVSGYRWLWGDGAVDSNAWQVIHVYTEAGDRDVVLEVWNLDESASATLTVHVVSGYTNYVSTSGGHVPPFETWSTAATNIQAAIDANMMPGGMVLVSNGTYDAGTQFVDGLGKSRVAVTREVTVRGHAGPEATFIVGRGPRGSSAVRCAYLGIRSRLEGFTLTNGHTTEYDNNGFRPDHFGGGAWCEPSAVVSNCTFTGNAAGQGGAVSGGRVQRCNVYANVAWYGGGAYACVVEQCSIEENFAYHGGGTHGGVIEGSTIYDNEAEFGGGTYEGIVRASAVSNNTATWHGGGSYWSDLFACVIAGNQAAKDGGGVAFGSVTNCTITGNAAGTAAPFGKGGGSYGGDLYGTVICGNSAIDGGGAYEGTVRNSALMGNSADKGGGAYDGTMENCTLVGNTAAAGGGTYLGVAENCIIYYNTASSASNNIYGSTVSYSCVTPPPGGTGNITNAPDLVSPDNPHLLPGSPCLDAGFNRPWMHGGADLDGEARIANGVVDIGCDEVPEAGPGGTLYVAIRAPSTNVLEGVPFNLHAEIEGSPLGYAWSMGDGTAMSNAYVVTHAYATAGVYDVVLEAWNQEGSASASLRLNVLGPYTNFVSKAGTHTAPYLSWAAAATNLQDAIAASFPGGLVLVTNGVYDRGGVVIHGSMTNRVAVTNGVTLRSVHGPEFTHIVGSGPLGDAAVRCAYVGSNACLQGFTLTNGHTRVFGGDVVTERGGGGAWCEHNAVISNCVIVGNQARYFGGGVSGGNISDSVLTGNSGSEGGAAFDSVAQNCVIVNNSTGGAGGGMYGGTARNCTIAENTAGRLGGGTAYVTVENSIVFGNHSPVGTNCYGRTADYSCTTPLPDGTGSITNDPLFLDPAGGDYRLAAPSPCINAGTNLAWMTGVTDLDGLPRIIHGTVDMGAYEWPHMRISSITPPAPSDGPVITWSSFTGAQYAVYGSTNLAHGYGLLLQEGIPALPPENAFTDTVRGAELRGYAVEYRPRDGSRDRSTGFSAR